MNSNLRIEEALTGFASIIVGVNLWHTDLNHGFRYGSLGLVTTGLLVLGALYTENNRFIGHAVILMTALILGALVGSIMQEEYRLAMVFGILGILSMSALIERRLEEL